MSGKITRFFRDAWRLCLLYEKRVYVAKFIEHLFVRQVSVANVVLKRGFHVIEFLKIYFFLKLASLWTQHMCHYRAFHFIKTFFRRTSIYKSHVHSFCYRKYFLKNVEVDIWKKRFFSCKCLQLVFFFWQT